MLKKVIIVISLVLLVGCRSAKSEVEQFKEEYESLNDSSNIQIEISLDSKVKFLEKDKIVDALSLGTHVVYLGWPTCPLCRNVIGVLLKEIDKYSGINLYYYNLKEIRDKVEQSIEDEDSQLYDEIVNVIELSDNDLTDFPFFNNGKRKIPAHGIYFVKDGEIIAIHTNTVEGHIDDFEPLSQDEQGVLAEIFDNYLDKLTEKNPLGCSGC